MKEAYKNLLQAPWSGQKLGVVSRILAWLFILCSSTTLSVFVYYSIKEGVPTEYLLYVLGAGVGMFYITILFAHVAIKGKAPNGWIPWR